METRSNHRVRFKPFELDLSTRELRRNGLKLRLQGQPVEVLGMLLDRPGDVVTREEIQRRLWPEDTFVDFEHSLNSTIRRLREALGDSADNPRYIETLPRLGYRFIAPVESTNGFVSLVSAPDGKVGETRTNVDTTESLAIQDAPLPRRSVAMSGQRQSRRWLWVLGGATIVALAAFVIRAFNRPLAPRVTRYVQITHDGVQKSIAATDGIRLYFTYDDNSLDPIAEASVTGGAITHIPVHIERIAWLEDVSPDGSNFLINTNEHGIIPNRSQWNLRIPGGSLHRLPDAQWGAFSPDGNTVAYLNMEGDIWLVQSDGSDARKLASSQSGARSPTWSPNGSAIRFFRDDGLWEISLSGANLRQVLPTGHVSSKQCCGKWSPDGRFFAFLNRSNEPFAPAQIWLLDERRGLLHHSPAGPIQLTTGPVDWDSPVPAKNGKMIFATGTTYRGELSRFDSRSGQFLPYLGGISVQGVSYSKDGRFVAYVTYPDGALWRANRDGTSPVQLTDVPIKAFLPRWSPDGAQILFEDLSSSLGRIYVVSTAGGNPERLLPQEKGSQSDPRWSPDGKKIVFSTAGYPKPSDVLRILDLTTHEITTVPGSVGAYSPRWSPNGRFIAALPFDSLGLKIFDVETERWSEWRPKDTVGFPEWSQDSQSIYFISSNAGADTAVFRMRVRGGEEERVADLNSVHLGGWWGGYMGLDPTDAPLVVREVGTSDIYALTLEYR